MLKPNYKDGCIVNLMSSIGKALGSKSKHSSLKTLNIAELKKSKNIVLMIIDGLGYEFLRKHGKGTVFNKNLKGKITSVFPSSTSAAIPALLTGYSPQEHGMTGWYMYLKEFGSIIIPLLYTLRLKKDVSISKFEDIKKIFYLNPLANRIKSKPYLVMSNKIINADFTIAAAGKSKRLGCNTTEGYFRTIKKIIKSNNQKKYIYAYYPDHDSLCHKRGSTSKKVVSNFKDINKKLESFLKAIKGTNTTVIVTADHGIIDVPASRRINLKKHPKLRDTLALPLCGEHRFAYCYVKPSRVADFEKYVKTKLKHCCNLYKSKDLLKKGIFGRFKIHKSFSDRIGDYTLIMKENYGIYDRLIHEKDHYNLGDHGGMSKQEMYVPLIVIKT